LVPKERKFQYPMEALEYFKKKGAEGGRKAAQKMTKAERIARAKKASEAAAKARSAKAKAKRKAAKAARKGN
jgi:hypothetical protein